MPWYTKAFLNLMEFSDGRYKWDASDMDIAYKIAEEELCQKIN